MPAVIEVDQTDGSVRLDSWDTGSHVAPCLTEAGAVFNAGAHFLSGGESPPPTDSFGDDEMGTDGIRLYELTDGLGDSVRCADDLPVGGASGSDIYKVLVSQDGAMLQVVVAMGLSPRLTEGTWSSAVLVELGNNVYLLEVHAGVVTVGWVADDGGVEEVDGLTATTTEGAVVFSIPIGPNVDTSMISALGLNQAQEGVDLDKTCDEVSLSGQADSLGP
jgi:hypothetical protein